MTIHILDSKVQYFGDDVQTVFAANFRFFQDTNLNVYLDGVLQTYVTDYLVTNSGDETGSSVTFTLPPPAPSSGVDGIITIERALDNQQLLDLIEFDRFPAESVEASLDYIVLLIQQNTTALQNVLRASGDVPPDVDLTVPAPGDGQFFKYTDDGKGIETADINELGTQIVPTMTDGEIVAGTGTQTRLINAAQTKLAVTTHETPPVSSVFDSGFHEVVDVLPGSPLPNVIYMVRQ